MSKYIVKNCPAYIHRPLNHHDRVCLLGDKVKPNHKELYVLCQDCPDCLIKQVIEKCKEANVKLYNRTNGRYYSPSKARLGRGILQLFEIEECE